MIRTGIAAEVRWFLVFLFIFAVAGFIFGKIFLFLLAGCLVYIGRLLLFLHRLELWVGKTTRGVAEPHRLPGIWAEIAEDVTSLTNRMRRDKKALQSSVQRVQDMTSALTDGVVLIDPDSNMDWWNEAAEKLLQLRELDRGHKVSNFVRSPDFIQYFEGGNYEEPLTITSPRRESLHLQFQVQPFGKGERILVVRDISRVFRLEQMRKDFVANVSHELRTPLTVVRGYLETLEDSPDMSPVWQRAIRQMLEQSRLMTALVNDLITLAKLETDEKAADGDEVSISELVETIVGDAKVLSADKNQRFHHSGDPNLKLLGVERELRSAFSNLVFNAVNYSPVDSDISVEYAVMGDEVVLMVTDTGSGIDPKHIPRLTERFYRVDSGRSKESGGTGLGLAIVKHVLLRHDADLQITSKLGVGSKFSCHFPIHRLVASSQNEASA